MVAFKRSIELSIQVANTIKTYRANSDDVMLQIEFNIKKSVKGSPSSGEITIFGLQKEDIALISTNFNPQSGQLKPSLVSLIGGYASNASELISGNIITAIPSLDNSNYSVKIQVQSGGFNNLQNNAVSYSIENATLRQICENIAKNNGVALDFKAKDRSVGDYAFAGSPFYQIVKFREAYKDKDIFISGKSLVVQDIDFVGKKVYKLSNSSGLIGTPKPTQTGCEIQMLLNPFLEVGDCVDLKSLKLPQLNGIYSILELSHIGGNRSTQWLSQIKAQNRSLSGS